MNGKYGVYGTDGKLRLAHKFDNLGATTRGWYEGELDGNWVYVSPEGKITTDMSDYLNWLNSHPE